MNRGSTATDAALAEPTPLSRNFVWADVTPATAVVELVAEATDEAPTDLDPLHGAVDTDALNRVVEPTEPNASDTLQVSFSYQGFFVVVRQSGQITLYDLDD
jgi:hypothetical protein